MLKLPPSYQSKAGYSGALWLIIGSFISLVYNDNINLSFPVISQLELRLVLMVAICFIIMLVHEFIQRRVFWKQNPQLAKQARQESLVSTRNLQQRRRFWPLLKSSLIRYGIYLAIIALPWAIVNYHYYFQDPSFNSSRWFYTYILYAYLLLGFPYVLATLVLKGDYAYEFNDYAMLSLVALRAIFRAFNPFNIRFKSFKRLANKRIRKLLLVFLVNFFFLSLMTKFIMLEYSGVLNAYYQLQRSDFETLNILYQYRQYYFLIFHLIFVVDVGLAIIGYSVASRWLDNRTKSVDMSLYGWAVVLLCYPPMNSGFTDQFIGYGRLPTEQLITSDIGIMIILALILCCFFIYVWATAAMGFKFSNLTNRGLVSHGPYRYFRHPAYSSKNLAWWVDNTHVLTNLWASLALLSWNLIYILRGITEERHLSQDPAYQDYKEKVKGRFLPHGLTRLFRLKAKARKMPS